MVLGFSNLKNSANFPYSADVVIIGAGIVGAFTAWELVRRGLTVIILEKGTAGAEQSGLNWGWCRQLNRTEAELPLIAFSLRRWGELSEELSESVGFQRSGISFVGRDETEMASWEKWSRIAKNYDIKSHILTTKQLTETFSDAILDCSGGILSPDDGYAEPKWVVSSILRAAVKRGATLLENCSARTLENSGGVISGVWTEYGLIKTECVVLSGGIWSSLFCRKHGISLPSGNVCGTVFKTQPLAQKIRMPLCTPDFACRPNFDGSYTVSVPGRGRLIPGFQSIRYARHFFSTYTSSRKSLGLSFSFKNFLEGPESLSYWSKSSKSPFEKKRNLDVSVDKSIITDGLDAMRKIHPAFSNATISYAWSGIADNTPDSLPIICEVDRIPGLFISTGYSARGFGISPGAGRLMADLISGAKPIVDPKAFKLNRF